jgi:hypothetical protein
VNYSLPEAQGTAGRERFDILKGKGKYDSIFE